MNLILLQQAVSDMKNDLEYAITTATYGSTSYRNGQIAKEALIRSSTLIMRLHEVVKQSLVAELENANRRHSIYPPIGLKGPELKITGYIKAKNQDIVVLFDDDKPQTELVAGGPLDGTMDPTGKIQSERSIVIGVRSQMSSVNKNFDTLMERAFAETLNLRLRLPRLVMGEVYLLPVYEYDSEAMKINTIKFQQGKVDIEKFIRTFFGISGRRWNETFDDVYKYERSSLVLVDFRQNPPKLYLTLEDLQADNLVSVRLQRSIADLSPCNFATDIIETHRLRHIDPNDLTTDIEPESVHPLADHTT